jgi:hypothetical protein
MANSRVTPTSTRNKSPGKPAIIVFVDSPTTVVPITKAAQNARAPMWTGRAVEIVKTTTSPKIEITWIDMYLLKNEL